MLRESGEFATPERVYVHGSVVVEHIVPLLTFADVYALTHTCKTMRRLVDSSTYWIEFLEQMHYQHVALDPMPRVFRLPSPLLARASMLSRAPPGVQKRLALVSLRHVCFACLRSTHPMNTIVGVGETHRLCSMCVSSTRIDADVYAHVRRLTGVEWPHIRPLARVEARPGDTDRWLFPLQAALVQELYRLTRRKPDGAQRRALVTEYTRRIERALRLPRRPYIFAAIDATERARGVRRSSRTVALVKHCVLHAPDALAPLTSMAATQCQLNACRRCCIDVDASAFALPTLCMFHQRMSPPKRRRSS